MAAPVQNSQRLQEYFSPEEIKEATMHGTNSALQRYLRTDMRKLKGVYQKTGSPGCPER